MFPTERENVGQQFREATQSSLQSHYDCYVEVIVVLKDDDCSQQIETRQSMVQAFGCSVCGSSQPTFPK